MIQSNVHVVLILISLFETAFAVYIRYPTGRCKAACIVERLLAVCVFSLLRYLFHHRAFALKFLPHWVHALL